MKNLDIEKLERKNIYQTREDLFDEMQKKVLQETIKTKQGKIVKLNWVYVAAAAIALFFGVNFMINQNQQNNPVITEITQSSNKQSNSLSVKKIENEEAVALRILEEDLTGNQKENEKPASVTKKQKVGFANQKNKKTPQNTEIQVEQILANFTSAELADVGKNTEQDIYLDLYN